MAAFYIRFSTFGFAIIINSTQSHGIAGLRSEEELGRFVSPMIFRLRGALRRRGRTRGGGAGLPL